MKFPLPGDPAYPLWTIAKDQDGQLRAIPPTATPQAGRFQPGIVRFTVAADWTDTTPPALHLTRRAAVTEILTARGWTRVGETNNLKTWYAEEAVTP